jgi:hypothetical protein
MALTSSDDAAHHLNWATLVTAAKTARISSVPETHLRIHSRNRSRLRNDKRAQANAAYADSYLC